MLLVRYAAATRMKAIFMELSVGHTNSLRGSCVLPPQYIRHHMSEETDTTTAEAALITYHYLKDSAKPTRHFKLTLTRSAR